MIIGYCPGAGGNRLYRALKGFEYSTPGLAYDRTMSILEYQDRYPASIDHPQTKKADILTHCMNTTLLKNIWPGREIYIIMADEQACLRREWMLRGHERYLAKQKQEQEWSLKRELYDAIKDASWPAINHSSDIDNLPSTIQHEFQGKWQQMSSVALSPEQKLRKKYDQMIDSSIATILWHKDYYQRVPVDTTFADHVIDLSGTDSFEVSMKEELSLYDDQLFDDCWNLIYG